MELRTFLAWVITPGAGLLAAFIASRIPAITKLAADLKRLVTGAVAAAIGILAYLAQIGMLYVQAPETWRGWVEALFAVAFIAAGISDLSRFVYTGARAFIARRKERKGLLRLF